LLPAVAGRPATSPLPQRAPANRGQVR
jgi:hypothetical protein